MRASTKVDGEAHAAAVQLQAQGVGRVAGRGCHENAVGPLGAEAQRHVLRLRMHGHGQLHLHKLAAVVRQDGRVCGRQRRGGVIFQTLSSKYLRTFELFSITGLIY